MNNGPGYERILCKKERMNDGKVGGTAQFPWEQYCTVQVGSR